MFKIDQIVVFMLDNGVDTFITKIRAPHFNKICSYAAKIRK